MKRAILLFSIIAAVCLLSADVFAQQDEPGKIVEEAKGLFAGKKWARALRKFKLALQVGAKGEVAAEAALYVGAIYAETGQTELASQNFAKYLAEKPTAGAPATFTGKMKAGLEEARKLFPIVSDIMLAKETFKPYKERFEILFGLEAAESVLEKTSITFRILAEEGRDVMHELGAALDLSAAQQQLTWDGKNRFGMYLANGDYIFVVEASREDGWKHSSECHVEVTGNMETAEVAALRKKARRIERLSGQRRIDYLPGKPYVKLGEKPKKSSMKGFWNYVYYIPIGAIRDVLDFPVKFLLSLKGVGHVMSATVPFIGGYELGHSLWTIDKDDYYDSMMGFDDKAWDHDKQVIEQRSMVTGVFGPVWGLAYGGVMSVVSWAGTEGGIAKGFTSYIDSNAFRNGYNSKYFFPNYRSLDFSIIRIDKERLATLEATIRQTNENVKREIRSVNDSVDSFNRTKLQAFKRQVADRYNKVLHDSAQMTVKGK